MKKRILYQYLDLDEFGNECLKERRAKNEEVLREFVGKKIRFLGLREDALYFEMEDGSRMKLEDAGQQCCEIRHMSTDDDLSTASGEKLVSILEKEIKEHIDPDNKYCDVKEILFVDIITDRDVYQVVNHNEHNGYYGGFDIALSKVD